MRLVFFLMLLPTTSLAAYSPIFQECAPSQQYDPAPAGLYSTAYVECLDRSLISELERIQEIDPSMSPVTRWEMIAIRAITGDEQRKTVVDIVRPQAHETAIGWTHCRAGRDCLGLNIPYKGSYPIEDPNWRYATLAFLYSDASVALQLQVWRERMAPARNAAWEAGWRGCDLAMALAFANSAQYWFIRLGNRCGWNRSCVIRSYATNDHRARRVEELARLGCEF